MSSYQLLFSVIGEISVHVLHLPIPGMSLAWQTQTMTLMLGIILLEQVKTVADGLLK